MAWSNIAFERTCFEDLILYWTASLPSATEETNSFNISYWSTPSGDDTPRAAASAARLGDGNHCLTPVGCWRHISYHNHRYLSVGQSTKKGKK